MRQKRNFYPVLLIMIPFLAFVSTLPVNSQGAQNSYKVIDTKELASIHSMDVWDFILIDSRSPEEYEEVHIKGAILIPQKKFEEYCKNLPASKTVKLIFYCNGVKCGKSKKAAKQAAEKGYENIYVYAEGMPVWEEKGLPIYKGPDYEKKIATTIIPPSALKGLVNSGQEDFTIVDVRDKEEYVESHIPGSINIPVQDFALKSEALDKGNKIVVYCNSGGRSYQAYRKLMKLGYTNIAQAIFADWKAAGYKVE